MPAAQPTPQDVRDFALVNFGGLDTSSDPTAVADQDFPWLFDMFPVGNGYMPVVPGPTRFATGLGNAQWIDYANLGGVDYAVHMSTTGTLTQVGISSGTKTSIQTGLTAAQCQATMWSNTNLLVIDANVGYGQWNGSTWTLIDGTNKGYSIAVHQGRVWIANGRTVTYSAPGSFTDFTTGSGGGSFTMNDSTLRGDIVALWEKDSILYIIGATSVNAIGDVTVPSGSTAPVFSNSNLQASVGTPFLRSVAELQRVIFCPSQAGVYAVYGVNAPKVSTQLDGILSLFTAIGGQFHGAVGNVLNQLAFAFLANLSHPNYSGPALACYVNKKWFLCQQGASLAAICGASYAGVPEMIGADTLGNCYRLFTDTSATMQGRVDTKLFSYDSPIFDHEVVRGGVLVYWAATDTATLTAVTDQATQSAALQAGNAIQFAGAGGANLDFVNNSSQPITFYGIGGALLKSGFAIRGKHLGLSLKMTQAGNWVRGFLLRTKRATAW